MTTRNNPPQISLVIPVTLFRLNSAHITSRQLCKIVTWLGSWYFTKKYLVFLKDLDHELNPHKLFLKWVPVFTTMEHNVWITLVGISETKTLKIVHTCTALCGRYIGVNSSVQLSTWEMGYPRWVINHEFNPLWPSDAIMVIIGSS